MALPCIPANFAAILCGLQETVAEIVTGAGHPPFTLTYSGTVFSFDSAAKTANIPIPVIPATPAPEVVVVSDASARGALAPTKLNSLLIQTTDPANGNFSVWAAISLAAGGWVLKVATLGAQNANAVNITGGTITGIIDLAIADGGTGASTAAGARANLALVTGAPAAGAINWLTTDNWADLISAPQAYNFTNAADGLSITVAVASTGAHAVTWPAGVKWPGNVTPTHSGAGKTDVYSIQRLNGILYGSVVQNFTT